MSDPDPEGVWLIGAVVSFIFGGLAFGVWQAILHPYGAAVAFGIAFLAIAVPYIVGRLVLRWFA